jgi:hypothetical protein
VAQLGARLDGIEEVVGSNPIGSTKDTKRVHPLYILQNQSASRSIPGLAVVPFHRRIMSSSPDFRDFA